MLYFAYGSNMSRAHMARLCPDAEPVGLATLSGFRFFISRDGYGSIRRAPGTTVHGVLWRVGARDLKALDGYEHVQTGLYRRAFVTVRHAGGPARALAYVTNELRSGAAQRAYCDAVLTAAQEWQLPPDYVRELTRELTA